MKDKTSIRRRIKDISIAKKLYFIVGTMAILIVVELFTLWFAIHTLSSLRALVGAEGLWSKAEKDAVYELNKYYRTHDEKDYASFQKFMRVPEGDHTTRMELLKKDMDINVARQGFIEGRVHPADIDGMISMLRRFYKVSYLSKAIFIWGQGDSTISELVPIGQKIKEQINAPHPSQQILDSLLNRADIINGQVTQLEDDFSYTLGEGSRWLEHLVLELLFSVALIVEITGLTLSISVSRNITKGLRGIIATTDKIKRGDLAVRAPVYSGDEIGQRFGGGDFLRRAGDNYLTLQRQPRKKKRDLGIFRDLPRLAALEVGEIAIGRSADDLIGVLRDCGRRDRLGVRGRPPTGERRAGQRRAHHEDHGHGHDPAQVRAEGQRQLRGLKQEPRHVGPVEFGGRRQAGRYRVKTSLRREHLRLTQPGVLFTSRNSAEKRCHPSAHAGIESLCRLRGAKGYSDENCIPARPADLRRIFPLRRSQSLARAQKHVPVCCLQKCAFS